MSDKHEETAAPKHRPAGVPPEAWWSAEDNEWVLAGKNAEGKLHGPTTYWRPDGSLVCKSTHVDGVIVGVATRFHQSGEVSQTASYESGVLHGTRTWYATDTETTEVTRAPGMHESIWRSEMDYERGEVVRVRHFDREGRRVLPGDGSLYPTPPEGVPADAEYNASEERWQQGRANAEQKKHGLWRCWSTRGLPTLEVTYENNVRVGRVRKFDDEGALCIELTYEAGRRHGPAKVLTPDGGWLSGAFEQGVVVGTWTLTGADGRPVKTISVGPHVEDLTASPAFADVPAGTSDAHWHALAEKLAAEGRGFESLSALMRLAAKTRDASVLSRALAARALPPSPAVVERLARDDEDSKSEGHAATAAALLLGLAEPGDVLESIGDMLHQNACLRPALDVIDAALLLDPRRWGCIFTRVLVRLGLGDTAAAEADVASLAALDEDAADYLGTLARVVFSPFRFWAGEQRPKTTYANLPKRPEQSLEAIQRMVAKYARRLTTLREALATRVPGNTWIPDVAHLTRPDVTLETYTFEHTDTEDNTTSVDVDETIDLSKLDVLDIVQLARRDYKALTYLCWSAGLDEVAMPESISPPKGYGKAAGMSAERLWRARDLRAMNGMGARMTGAPSFTWEEMDLEEMDRRLVSIVEREYAELAALFRWLSDEDHRSVWQDNLRYSGKAMPLSRRQKEEGDQEEDEVDEDDAPPRPANVDPAAVWKDDEDTWELAAPMNERGRLHGTAKVWRENGALRQEERFDDGRVAHSRLFHPDGALAIERTYHPEVLSLASVTRHAPTGKSDVPFPRGGLDPRVVQARYTYDVHGYMTEFVGLDADGTVVAREEVNRSLDNRVPQEDFASIEEASRIWNEKNDAYYAALNRFIAKLNGHEEEDESDEDEDEDEPEEPTDERGAMERYVLRALERLNQEGRFEEARKLFAPSFEPFSEAVWQAHGKVIRKVAALETSTLVNADDEVFSIRGDTIEKLPGVLRFGVSKSKRTVAACYPDHVDVVEVGTARPIARYAYPKDYGEIEGVSPDALSREPFRSPYHLGIERVAVSDAGDIVVLATKSGIFFLRKGREPRLALPSDECIPEVLQGHESDEPYRITLERPEVDLDATGRILALSYQFAEDKPLRLTMVVNDDLSAEVTTFDEHDRHFGPSLYHSNGKHYLLSLGTDDDESGVFTFGRDYVDGRESLLEDYEGSYSARSGEPCAVGELGDEFLVGMSDCYLWRQEIDNNTQDYVYVGVGAVGPRITSIDVTPDQQEILVGTSYGAVWRLARSTERGKGFATNMKLADRRRYLFLRTFDPMIW